MSHLIKTRISKFISDLDLCLAKNKEKNITIIATSQDIETQNFTQHIANYLISQGWDVYISELYLGKISYDVVIKPTNEERIDIGLGEILDFHSPFAKYDLQQIITFETI